MGNILTWQQQADSAAPTTWRYGYDRADQLIGAIQETTDPTPTILHEYAYGYDPAGNRLYEQIDSDVTAWTYTNLNRLQAQAGGGVLQLRGAVNEPATVAIQGVQAAVSSANAFQGGLPVVPGTNVFTVTATDGSGNTATAQYEVDVTNAPKTFTYDANGNLTADGTRTFEWDARNQLVAVTEGLYRSEFIYDGLQRRVGKVTVGDPTGSVALLWCGLYVCEERASGTGEVRLREYSYGAVSLSGPRFHARDSRGSLSVVTDSVGQPMGRYDYDAFGRVEIAGEEPISYSFAGLTQFADGQYFAVMRAYDPSIGRWLSEDPIGFNGGMNFSRYVDNNPVSRTDYLGLVPDQCPQPCTPVFDRKAYTSCLLNWSAESVIGALACTGLGVHFGGVGAAVAAPPCVIVTAVSLATICVQCARICSETGRSMGQCFPDTVDEELNRPESGDPRRPQRPPRGSGPRNRGGRR
ncbi:MAG: RHS repeat-associated core domain-containing protein [Acidobacteria bacterium]|nr:RHS repeat-associated core domain-containing protein [Acidobacteriota bacterium]